MSNILCIYENKIATVAGLENFFVEFEKYDARISVRFVSVLKLTCSDLSWCDVLYIIRPNNAVFGRVSKLAKRYGITTVCFLDDDLLHLPNECPDMPWRKKGLVLSARNSDIIVSSSPYICSRYSRRFSIPRSTFVDTAVPSDDIKQHDNNKNERIKIVYAAGLGHTVLFDRFIKPTLKRLDDRCGEKISLTFMGVHPELEVNDYKMPIEYIDSMSLNEYRKRISEENFDLGLAPLVSNKFTKCKYYNKFIEYAMFGIVGLYSNTEPYTFVIKDREDGILIEDDPNSWLEAICSVVEDKLLINKCRENAYNLLKNRFALDKIIDNLVSDIPEIVGEHKDKQVKSFSILLYKMVYRISRFGDWIYKTGFYFKRGGIKEVFSGVRRIAHSSKITK